jgi:FG-GAP-like repeat
MEAPLVKSGRQSGRGVLGIPLLTLCVVPLASCNNGAGASIDLCAQNVSHFAETGSFHLGADFENASIATGDVDGDGTSEVAVVSPGGSAMVLSLPDGKSYTVRKAPTAIATNATGVVLFDVDGDGSDEVVVTSTAPDRVLVLDGRTLTVRQTVSMPAHPSRPFARDLDGDGSPELIVADINASQVSVLGVTGGQLGVRTTVSVPSPLNAVSAEDLDGDGFPELLVSSFTPTQGSLRVYSPAFGPGPKDASTWNGFATSPVRTETSTSPRFAVTASRFASGASSQLLEADGSILRSWDPTSFTPATTDFGFETRGLSTLDVDGDLNQDLFALGYPSPLDSGGHTTLGAVAYGTANSVGAPLPIQVSYSGRETIPVYVEKPWILALASIGVDGSNNVALHTLLDTCTRPSDVRVVSTQPATQLIQARDGSVPLYSGKPTVIPVTVASRHEIEGVTLRAEVINSSGSVTAVLPLAQPQPRQRLRPGADGHTVFNVIVPAAAATAGTVAVRVTVVPPTSAADADATNNSVSLNVSFQQSQPVTFFLVHWRYRFCTTADQLDASTCKPNVPLQTLPLISQGSIDSEVAFLRQELPTGDLTVQEVELDDPGFALPKNTTCLTCLNLGLTAARSLFNQQHPGFQQNPVYFMVDSIGGFTPSAPSLNGAGSIAVLRHEVGHMAGAAHVPCAGNPPEPNPAYPFDDGRIGGPTGDVQKYSGVQISFVAAKSTWNVATIGSSTCDMMSYGSPRWPSSWTYDVLHQGVERWTH